VTLEYTYNGGSMTHAVAPSTLSLPSRAWRGSIEEGSVAIEDPSGNLTLVGLKPFHVEESACTQPRLFTGYLGARAIGRSYDAGQFVGASARVHEAAVYDLNAVFMFRLISGSDGKRPEETWDTRLAWLLASDYLDGLIEDTGHIGTITRNMEAADYRGRYPLDVLNDLVDRTGEQWNYYAWWDPDAGPAAVSLWFQGNDASSASSTLRVSNDPADYDGSTTFAPFTEARLEKDPQDTYSEVMVEYANGTVYATLGATATAYIRRGTTLSRPYTGRSATAQNQANAWLQAHANERNVVTCSIKVPRAQAGLVTAGQRMEAKFTHLPGLTSFTWCRVAFSRPTPVDDAAKFYVIELELEVPRTSASASDACNTPGVWTASFGYLGAVTASYSAGVSAPAFPVYYSDGNTDANASSYGSSVWGAGTYYRGWIVDMGAEYEVSNLTHVGRLVGGIDGDYASSGGLVFRGGTDLGSMSSLAGTTTVSMNGWDAGVGEHAIGFTHELDTPTVCRYIEVRDTWTVPTWFAYRAQFYGFQLLIEACDGEPEVTIIEDLLGTRVEGVTPAETPDGSTVLFTLPTPYMPGTLRVFVDNLDQTAAVTETDPTARKFTLGFAPYTGEAVTATYLVG